MTPAERSLLLAVFRWARANEWVRLGDGWCSKTESVTPTVRGAYIYSQTLPVTFVVAGIAESVDVLVALGILPHRFSTSYRAGFEECHWAHGIAVSPAVRGDWNGPQRGWSDPDVVVLLPAAWRELAAAWRELAVRP